MAKTVQVTIKYDSEKLRALRCYLSDPVEELLSQELERLYNEKVPENVQSFIGFHPFEEAASVSKSKAQKMAEQTEDC